MGFRPGKVMTLLVAVFLPLTLTLGTWQLNRAAEKNQVLADLASQPDEIMDWQAGEPPAPGRAVSLCVTREGGEWFLDNRTHDGQVGYDVYLPARLCGDDQPLLLRLGWIAQEDGRSSLPALGLPAPDGENSVMGEMRPASPEPWLTAPPEAMNDEQWRIQSMQEVPDAEFGTGAPIVQVRSPQNWALEDTWDPVNMPPSRHIGYAVQWFGLALALVICYLIWGIRRHKSFQRKGKTHT